MCVCVGGGVSPLPLSECAHPSHTSAPRPLGVPNDPLKLWVEYGSPHDALACLPHDSPSPLAPADSTGRGVWGGSGAWPESSLCGPAPGLGAVSTPLPAGGATRASSAGRGLVSLTTPPVTTSLSMTGVGAGPAAELLLPRKEPASPLAPHHCGPRLGCTWPGSLDSGEKTPEPRY